MIQLYNGDCLEIMPQLIAEGVRADLILCDLPYGVTSHKDDKPIPFEKLWECYNSIISDNGAIVLFAQGQFYVDLVNSNRKMFKYDLVWDKQLSTGFLNANKMPLRRHESIAVFYKRPPIYNPQKSIGKPNHSKGTKHLTKELFNQNYGEYKSIESEKSDLKHPTSIVSFQKPHPSKCVHRTEKPIALLEYLIRTYTNEGMTVLDNCFGSCSTGLAALNTGRNFIGIEIDKHYFELGKQRLNEDK
ncbi:MAG: site-specific DNA-methyltransferase [Rikenellaceae bacterium]